LPEFAGGSGQHTEPIPTLPDYLSPGLTIVFVGINPGLLSARRGHYFARRSNRFWPAFSRSQLSAPIRAALGRDLLTPEDDLLLPDFGIGFTDVVKRPTSNAGELRLEEFVDAVPRLLAALQHCSPNVACFHGLTGYRPFARYGLGAKEIPRTLGAQASSIAATRLFVVPSPSPANAHYSLSDQIEWYDHLACFCDAGIDSTEKPDAPYFALP
jgi:double-stranded uracil-DNA glycosylase